MSDPKDKLVLFKEVLSLMVVMIGFITALMTSGIVKNIKVDPLTLIVIIALALFFIQFLVRVMLGEEHYNEIKKKALSTARDFSIVVLVIIGFYFAGKYASNYNTPGSPQFQVAEEKGAAENGLSSAPLKNLKKEKVQPPLKPKDKQAAKKSDDKPSKTDDKSVKSEHKAVKAEEAKPADKNEKPAVKEHAKQAENKPEDKKSDIAVTKPAVKEEKKEQPASAIAENTSNAGDVKKPGMNISEGKTAPVELKSPIAAGPDGLKAAVKNDQAVKNAVEAGKTSETAIVTEKKVERTAEAAINAKVNNDKTAETAVSEKQKPDAKKPLEPVVINVIAEEPPAAANKDLKSSETELLNDKAVKSNAVKGSDEVLTYKMTKEGDEDDNVEDISEAGTTVKFEQTSSDMRDKVNNDKILIKKEYEINKTPAGIKNAGEKVMEGGKKIFDGGANLLEKAGHGIKKQINKVIK